MSALLVKNVNIYKISGTNIIIILNHERLASILMFFACVMCVVFGSIIYPNVPVVCKQFILVVIVCC